MEDKDISVKCSLPEARPAGVGTVDRSSAGLAEVTVRLAGIERKFPCTQGQTILDAALAVGIELPFSCREGHCGACMAVLRCGTVAGEMGAVLSRRDRMKGYILVCQGKPTSEQIYINYDD